MASLVDEYSALSVERFPSPCGVKVVANTSNDIS